jgi:hypothetical protein
VQPACQIDLGAKKFVGRWISSISGDSGQENADEGGVDSHK